MEGGCQNSPVRKSNRAAMHGDCLFKKSLREAKTAGCRGKEVLCKMISQKELPIRRGCASLEISRRTYYCSLKERRIDTSDKAITDGILDIASEFQKYGYRRITAELHRRGQPVNHKKVLRIMREENILCTPKKKFRITTTDSNQGVQYACGEYVNRLNELGIRISISRKGNPYDNAFAESFMKTLKAEEVYLKEYMSKLLRFSSVSTF